jgi:hypothetical protein
MEKNRNVSWSEIQLWCACRQKWHWAYGVGIVPVRTERAPSVGSCGHAAIAAMLRGKDWAVAVAEWLIDQTKRHPSFDEEIAEMRSVADTVIGIMPRYVKHYRDNFETVLVEHKFEVPIRGIRARLIGYWDAIVRDADGKLWLNEHKFPQRSFRSDDDLDLDGQVGVYQYAAHRLGYPVVGTIYNQILGRVPAEPKVNKDGSLSRAKVCTDWETYRAFAVGRGLNPADYAEMQEKLADVKFFQRNYIFRPPVEVKKFARDMERRIWDMRGSKRHVYRSESFVVCGRCPYRELCLETVKGGDVNYIIANQFEPKKSREEEINGTQTDQQTDPDPVPGI